MSKAYLVCATPRSGSTLLCEALKATCVVQPGDDVELVKSLPEGRKVTVTGRIQFTPDPNNQNEWLTVIRVEKGGLKKR